MVPLKRWWVVLVTNKVNLTVQLNLLVQVGSSIKPFIYAAALEKGLTLSSVLQDSPISIQKPGQPLWQPKNSPDRYDGPMRFTCRFRSI